MLLKREIGSKSWAMEAIVEAVCKGRWSGSLGRRRSSWIDHELAANWLQFSFEMATNFTTIGPRSGRDHAAIGPRSWSWSFVDRRPIDWRRFHYVSSPITARSRRDRGSIEPRSWSSSTNPQGRPMKIAT